MAKRENITDVFVIGGGVNGCGIARDAVGRGFSVFLAEMGDLASGTSSAATKLVHGGLRYLEYYEFRLVHEALAEREILWAMAPHIIWPMRFVLPHHKGLRPAWFLRLGLFVYDHLGARKLLPPTRTLDLRTDPIGKPLKDGYAKAFEYSDCWVDDARLVALTARDAADKGAIIQTRTKVIGATRENGLWTIRLQDVDSGLKGTVKAKLLVNAGGPWVDSILREAVGQNDVDHVRLVKGSHIVVRRIFEHDRAYFFQNKDGRIIFAIPYERDFTLIGTTDQDFSGDPRGIKISDEETQYLIAAASEYFERPLTTADIVWTYAGVRPLFNDHKSKAQEATRDYVLTTEGDAATGALVNVFGGKLTTHRRLSEEALEHIEKVLGKRGKPWTKGSKLPGGEFGPQEFDTQVERLNELYPNLADKFLRRLARQYGTRAVTVLGNAKRMQDLGEGFGADLTQREVEYLIDNEWARTADDVLWRRTKLGLRVGMGDKARLEAWFGGAQGEGKQVSGYVLAIDQGTTSSRAIVFNDLQQIVGMGKMEFTQHFPASGWVEHVPEEIWATSLWSTKTALKKAGITAADVAAIGITNQRETTIVWDRATGKAIHNAIVWQDRRTSKIIDRLKAAGHEKLVSRKTGLLLDPYFSATKISWILDNVPGARKRAERGELAFGTVDSYLIWRLTNGKSHATDASNACRTLLYNIETGDWDDELLALFKVPRAILPTVKDNADDFGISEKSILGAPIPILGAAGDQQAATIGQACFEPGMMKSTYGTGCFALLNTGTEIVRSRNRLLTTVAYRLNGKTTYALEGAIFMAGASVQWLRDKLRLFKDASETGALAKSAAEDSTVYLVPAFVGLGAPWWDADARGAIYGLTRNTGASDLARAALESVAYQTQDLLSAMRKDWKGARDTVLRVDGGMVASDWTMQFLSDILDVPVDRPTILETTALGAAWLAGHKAGVWPDMKGFSKRWALDRQFSPAMDASVRKRKLKGWNDAVKRTLTK